ncbi:MAG TPA: arylesterase [Alphaproteobacteria bacterium]|jgi:acyl-CoA thioesterase-1|nr:arylesterase [Alphaproteobacteria bacterium]HBF99014.1 arylesterase [Alphaproteobacteria bacterium]
MSEHIPNLNIFNGTVRRRAANAPVLWALLLLILPVVSVSTASASEAVQRLVILGDSLTAGYGLSEKEAFPARLEAHLKALGHAVEVEGAGVSGDTTAGGLARLDWSIGADADAVIVELGGNDALRGLSPALTEENLRQIVERLRARGLPVLLAGMWAPPNMGRDYADAFNAVFASVAAEYEVPLYPFFLEGVAADPRLNQADMIHPNAAGVEIIVERIAPYVIALLQSG